MTEQRFVRRNHGGGHSYLLDGQRVPGVTTIIGVLDKPALVPWAAGAVATYAVDNWDRLTGMSIVNRHQELSTAHHKRTTEAAVRGNRIHAIGEKLIQGEELAVDDQDLRSAGEAYVRLLDDWKIEPVAVELPCVNLDYWFAGTADAVIRSPKLGTLLVDIKTGKRAYSDVALQLAAYRNCDVFLKEVPQFGPRGGRLKSLWVEEPMPQVDGTAVIHIERETEESPAQAHLLPVYTGPDIFEQFLYLREIYEGWVQRVDWNHKNSAVFAPPIGHELHPEMSMTEIEEAIRS